MQGLLQSEVYSEDHPASLQTCRCYYWLVTEKQKLLDLIQPHRFWSFLTFLSVEPTDAAAVLVRLVEQLSEELPQVDGLAGVLAHDIWPGILSSCWNRADFKDIYLLFSSFQFVKQSLLIYLTCYPLVGSGPSLMQLKNKQEPVQFPQRRMQPACNCSRDRLPVSVVLTGSPDVKMSIQHVTKLWGALSEVCLRHGAQIPSRQPLEHRADLRQSVQVISPQQPLLNVQAAPL